METRPQPPPEFDWHAEQTGQRRELVRFDSELDRALVMKSRTPAGRNAAALLREHWERLKRRVDGRLARSVEVWDRQIENAERMRRERDRLLALVEFEERLVAEADLEMAMKHMLRCLVRSIPCDGAFVAVYESSGQARRMGTERGHGRTWPPTADQELTEVLSAGARGGQRIMIEGRPVGAGPRERGRISHWLAVRIDHADQVYGAVIAGRPVTDAGFGTDEAVAVAAVTARLGRYLSAKVGIAARPVLEASPRPEGFEHLAGQAPAFRKTVALAANYAVSETPILIEGEPGSGRRTLARAIHLRSSRAEKPFVTVTAANLPEDVIVRSLFGARTAGTEGTIDERPGDLEMADGGTLFLDEITALGPVTQVRLLRFLQEGTFEREGDRTLRRATVIG
jgi:transcriptional regulator with GAF, ATPase, and Fis domain